MQPALLALLGMSLSFAAGTWYGTGLGEDREYAKRAREDALVTQVRETSERAAADAIAKIKPRNVTIQQEIQREIETRTEYRDCRHGPGGMQLINEALTGRPQPAGGGQLPGADAVGR